MVKFCLGENGFIFGKPWHDNDIEREQILEFAKNEGFNGIELHPFFESISKGSEDEIRNELANYGLEIPCIQTGMVTGMYSPLSQSEETRKEFLDNMKEYIEFAHNIGASTATVSPPSFTPDIVMNGYSHDEMVNMFIDALGQLVETAEENKVLLAFEPEPQMILNGGFIRKPVEDTLKVLDAIQSDYVKVLYDVTHANTLGKGDPVGFLEALGGRVGWTHIADNDGWITPYFLSSNHLEFGKGNINIEAVMQALKVACPDLGWLQVDVWENPNPFETASKNKKVLEQIAENIGW
ncbi:MAG TPA: sugar phosphate isomerase/epimerase family protein [Candidatus Lokiarchaeia archaeon]|nr:sugar phosphate isomerase/epimerase family protein [Candidatus Lokiarchaeia archaeon]